LKLGHHEKALDDAEQCIKLDPTSVKGHFRRGKITVVICCCLWFVVVARLSEYSRLKLACDGAVW